jgi:hypothetical protein
MPAASSAQDGVIGDETRLDAGTQNIGNGNLAADKMKTMS